MERISLTKEDVRAIRSADRAWFDAIPNLEAPAGRPKAELVLSREVKIDGFGDDTGTRDVTRRIAVNAHQIVSEGGRIFFGGGTAGHGWPTVLKALVREGDELHFSWLDNSNQYVKSVGAIEVEGVQHFNLHADTLFLSIVRERRGKRVYVVNDMVCEVSICPDNSARAIAGGVDRKKWVGSTEGVTHA